MKMIRFFVLFFLVWSIFGCFSKNKVKKIENEIMTNDQMSEIPIENEIMTNDQTSEIPIENTQSLTPKEIKENYVSMIDNSEYILSKFIEEYKISNPEIFDEKYRVFHFLYNDEFFKQLMLQNNDELLIIYLNNINLLKDDKDYYFYFLDPFVLAVSENRPEKVKLIAQLSPQMINKTYNCERGGCQDKNALDFAKNNTEMISMLLSLGVSNLVNFHDNGWAGENCYIFVSPEDINTGNGIILVKGTPILAEGRVLVYDKTSKKYVWLFKLTNFEDRKKYFYARVDSIIIDPDL